MSGQPLYGITVEVLPLEQAQGATLKACIDLSVTKLGLNAVGAHELTVGGEGNVIQAAVEAGIVRLGRSDTVDAQFLHNHLVNIVNQIDVRCTVFGIGQHEGAVATHEHALHGSVKFKVGAQVTGKVELGGCGHITGQLRLGIVLVQVGWSLVIGTFEQSNGIGRLVGLDNDVAGCLVDELFPLAVNGFGGKVTQRLKALGLNSKGIGAGIQILEHEYTIIVIIGRVTCHFLTVLVQDNNGAIDGIPLVHR